MTGIYVDTRGVSFAFRWIKFELLMDFCFIFCQTFAQQQQSNEAFVSVRTTCSKLYIHIYKRTTTKE